MQKFEGKRLLILGGAPHCCKIVRAAKEMGIHTIVTDITKNAPAKKIADEALDFSLFEQEKILEWCRLHPVDGVINVCVDYGQKPHQYLCEKLGLPCYGNAEQVMALTDKPTFKRVCAENGLATIPDYTPEQVYHDEVVYPVFIKPAEGSGSRGSSICNNKAEALAAIDEALQATRNGKVLIEKYLGDKQDFMATFVLFNGECYLQRTTDRYHGFIEDGMDSVSALAVSPSKYTERFLADGTIDKIAAMLKRLGLKNGPAFVQGFVDDDVVRFYDPAIRLTGADFENLLKEITGVDVVAMFVEYAMSGKVTEVDEEAMRKLYLLNGKYTALAFPMVRPGTIRKIKGREMIESHPGVISHSYRHGEGETIRRSCDVIQRLGEYNVLADSKEELREILAMIQRELIVLDENGEDMVISKPNLAEI